MGVQTIIGGVFLRGVNGNAVHSSADPIGDQRAMRFETRRRALMIAEAAACGAAACDVPLLPGHEHHDDRAMVVLATEIEQGIDHRASDAALLHPRPCVPGG